MNSYEQMRKSVEKARNLLLAKVITGDNKMRPVYDILSKALALPRRNCDVGTYQEQGSRFLAVFNKIRASGERLIDTIMKWSQTPYTAEQKGDGNVEAKHD